MKVPKGLVDGKRRRNDELIPLPISSLITLCKGIPRLDIVTTYDNQAMDHRLRVCFPSGVDSKTVDVETAFDVVTRSIELPDTRDWVEPATGTQPHLSFFDISDKKGGLAVISHGLVEYEVQDNDSRTMILTLVKGLRYPKVGLPPERVERLEQVGSQCLGKHTSSYSLYPHEGNWQEGNVFEYAYRRFTPVKLIQCGPSPGELPRALQLLKIEPEELILSAIKKCETRESIIVRLFNPTEKEITGKIKFRKPIKEAWLTNLNEERKKELPINKNGSLEMKVEHKKIVTIELEF
jgi:alpha-mannosidase